MPNTFSVELVPLTLTDFFEFNPIKSLPWCWRLLPTWLWINSEFLFFSSSPLSLVFFVQWQSEVTNTKSPKHNTIALPLFTLHAMSTKTKKSLHTGKLPQQCFTKVKYSSSQVCWNPSALTLLLIMVNQTPDDCRCWWLCRGSRLGSCLREMFYNK